MILNNKILISVILIQKNKKKKIMLKRKKLIKLKYLKNLIIISKNYLMKNNKITKQKCQNIFDF
jgi:hypothetical protein